MTTALKTSIGDYMFLYTIRSDYTMFLTTKHIAFDMPTSIFQILENAAARAPSNGCIFYDEEHQNEPFHIFYPDLLQLAKVCWNLFLGFDARSKNNNKSGQSH